MRGHVLRFGKIGSRALIECGIQIIDLNQNPVRYAVVAVAAVLIRRRWKVAGEWIDPCTRTDLVWSPFRPADVRIRAPRAKMAAGLAIIGVTRAANRIF